MQLTAAEFNSAHGKNLNEYTDLASKQALEQAYYKKIFDVSMTSEWTTSYSSSEWVGRAELLSEDGAYPLAGLQNGWKVTYDTETYGLNIAVSREVLIKSKDNTEILMTAIKRLTDGALASCFLSIEETVSKMLDYTNATSSSYEVQSPDGQPIISSSHSWKSGLTFDNDLGTSAISIAHAKTVEAYGGSFKDGQGKAMPLRFNTIVVKLWGTASQQAKALYASKDAQGSYQVSSIGDINIYSGSVNIIETPYIASGNDYMYIADTTRSLQGNPAFVDIFKAPGSTSWFIEDDSTHGWTQWFDVSFKYGLKSVPFNLLGGKVA